MPIPLTVKPGKDEIIKCYDLDQLTEIANHGCKSGVANEHIYYRQTISFFDKYEGEILSTIEDQYGFDELVSIFKRSEACYDMYRNECTWLFIETVAQDVVNELEQIADDEEKQIMEYMKPIDNNPVDITNVIGMNSGLNHEKSMNLNRYSQV